MTDVEAPDSEDDAASTRSMPSLASPVISGWRGLAHYRTWSRRRVFQKSCEERTPSELYQLEETVTDVKLIGDLPLSKRLEVRCIRHRCALNYCCQKAPLAICKNLGYEKLEPNTTVYKQGNRGSIFYIVFTGSVKATKHIEGVQYDEVTMYNPGHWFGEAGIEMEDCLREATCVTAERTELLTLAKKDYDSILKIQRTPELQERVQFLKSIVAFRDVSKQSLRRLANVLSARTFNKNRVITFQGDDAVEMYFLKTGECRIIMEIHNEKAPPFLPRASSFLTQYWPTRHHRCKQEAVDREKDWWRPSLISRQSTAASRVSRCLSLPSGGVPDRLPGALLRSPDMIHQLVKYERTQTPHRHHAGCSTQCHVKGIASTSKRRPSTAPAAQIERKSPAKRKGSIAGSEDRGPLSPWGSPKEPVTTRASNRSSQGQHCSFADNVTTSAIGPGSQQLKTRPQSGVAGVSARFKSPSMMQGRKTTYHPGRRRSSVKSKYTLGVFLKDCETKEKSQKQADMEFSEKDHRLWRMGIVTEGMMPAVMMNEENLYYRQKFEKWARCVINRERKLLSYNVYAGTPAPSFMPGMASSAVLKLEQDTPEKKRSTPEEISTKSGESEEGTSILDIGALHAGQYFGERGLLEETRRAASIVAVTVVDTLVLNKWDFHRHCDRDVIKALSKHDYKKEEHIYKLYMKTRKWELFKRHVVDDVFTAKKNRIYKTTGPRAVRVVPKPNNTKKELPLQEWTY